MLTMLALVGGLVGLTVGAELLVRNASALAVAARVSPLVVGLTVVAYGTSSPELVVSIQSSLRGQAEIALGNVIGSNIFNVLFILGLSALVVPLRVSQQLVRWDVPLMIVLSFTVAITAWDGRIAMGDGLLLTTGLIAYTVWGIVQSRREQEAVKQEYAAEFGDTRAQGSTGQLLRNGMLVVLGFVLLVLGSHWFVGAATTIAREVGISELVIGLTIVAAGTSLPEAATSLIAAFRGERDIAVGNVVGSNIFNIMGVLGLSGIVSGRGVTVPKTVWQFDLPVMIAVAVACLPIFLTGHKISRWEGGLFLSYFCAYSAYLILAELEPAVAKTFEVVMLVFVLPLIGITLAVIVARTLGRAPIESDE